MFNKKGFLFIEGSIMMVVAVTGIVSAALFPMMTGYLGAGRDASRAAGIKEITTALAAYNIDMGNYPAVPASGCVPAIALARYLPKIPTDPIAGRISTGCDGSDGMTYVYRLLKNDKGLNSIILGADFENHPRGNSELSIDEILKLDTPIKHIENLRKGAGSYYIIYN